MHHSNFTIEWMNLPVTLEARAWSTLRYNINAESTRYALIFTGRSRRVRLHAVCKADCLERVIVVPIELATSIAPKFLSASFDVLELLHNLVQTFKN